MSTTEQPDSNESALSEPRPELILHQQEFAAFMQEAVSNHAEATREKILSIEDIDTSIGQ